MENPRITIVKSVVASMQSTGMLNLFEGSGSVHVSGAYAGSLVGLATPNTLQQCREYLHSKKDGFAVSARVHIDPRCNPLGFAPPAALVRAQQPENQLVAVVRDVQRKIDTASRLIQGSWNAEVDRKKATK